MKARNNKLLDNNRTHQTPSWGLGENFCGTFVSPWTSADMPRRESGEEGICVGRNSFVRCKDSRARPVGIYGLHAPNAFNFREFAQVAISSSDGLNRSSSTSSLSGMAKSCSAATSRLAGSATGRVSEAAGTGFTALTRLRPEAGFDFELLVALIF